MRSDPTLISIVNDVALFLPSRPISPSQTFDVPVRAHATYAVAMFSMLCTVSTQLSFENVSVDTARWVAEVRQQGSHGVGIVAMLRNPESVSTAPVQAAEMIFSMHLRLNSAATGDDVPAINCTVVFLSNIYNVKVQPRGQVTPVPVLIVDSNPLNDPYVGEVRVAQSSPRGLFSFARQAQVVNTAVFTFEPVYVPLTHWVVMSSGALVNATMVTCVSQSEAFQLSPPCTHIVLNGSEITGAELDTISVQYENFSVSVPLRVWYPSSGARLQATPSTLRPIAGWIAPNSTGQCSQQYQQASLSAQAVFSYSQSSPRFTVSILPLLYHLLTSSNPDIADIINNSSIQANTPGSCVFSAGPAVSPAVVMVTDQQLQVSSLDVTPFSGLSLLIPAPPYPLESTQLASVTLGQQFDFIGAPVYIAVLAVTLDGNVMPVDTSSGLVVESLDPSVIEMSGGNAVIVGRGSGELIRVVWQSPCTRDPIAMATTMIDTMVPDPIGLFVNLSSPRITFTGDRATFGGIPTASSLNVTLIYPAGQERVVTMDARTLYTLVEGGDLVTLSTSESQEITITPNISTNSVGMVTVSITYGKVVSANVSITVVRYQGLQMFASPYPPYPGSETIMKTTLFQIEGTGVFQQAALSLYAILTDNSTGPVELAFFQSSSPALTIRFGNIVSVTASGVYNVQGRFVTDTATLELTASSSTVSIESIQNISLGTGADSLRGVSGQTEQLYLTVNFSDQTLYLNFIPEATSIFPTLLSLSSDTPTAVTVNPVLGRVTLRSNYPSPVTITAASRSNNSVQAQISFACNLDPEVGDVDLGFPSGVPLPAVQVGETVSVPIRISTGPQSLMMVELAVVYSTNHLTFSSFTRGADWPGTLQYVHTPSVGLVSISGSSTGVGSSGLVHVATLSFAARTAGTAAFSGLVLQLLDSNGTAIGGELLPREIVAGEVDMFITGGRKRREALTRTRRNTMCVSPPPCATCPSTRETGDINGDCVFDERDSLFLLRYQAEELFDFQLSSGSTLLESIIPEQQTQFDADRNTAVDLSDAYFLLLANEGLLNFLSDVTITPIQESSVCTLSINTTLLNRGDVPASAQSTAVYFDISLPFGPTLTDSLVNQQRFDSSVVLLGATVPGLSKGPTLYGGVVEASPLAPGVFGIELETNLTREDVGVSVIQVTSADSRTTNPARTRAMFGRPDPPYAYPYPLDVNLPAFSDSTTILATYGYNPFTSLNNTVTTLACVTPPPPPVFTQPLYTGEVAENSPVGTTVLNVSAESQSSFPVAFSIGAGNPNIFSIDNTGALILIGTLDFEMQDSYRLVILATDTSSGLMSQASANITVTDFNDNRPVFEPPSPVLLPQNTAVGSVVAMVTATDADSGTNAALEYSIQSDNDTFAVETAQGIITLRKPLNFDIQSYYEMVVTATDMGETPLNSSVTLNVTVLPPDPTVLQFSQSIFNESVIENSPLGFRILQLQASPVSNETGPVLIRYSVDTPLDSPFDVQLDSGLLVVNGSVDREVAAAYELQVTAAVADAQRAVPARAVVFIYVLDQNDNTPEFALNAYDATLPENSSPGTLRLSVTATDPDLGANGTVQYSLLEPSSSLSINRATGVLTNSRPIDYESFQQLLVTVAASDMGTPPRTSSVNVTIDIIDRNDNAPLILITPSAAVNVSESTAVGTIVAVATATDRDSPVVNGEIVFSFVQRVPAFTINATSGEVLTATTIDFEAVQSYELTVMASDSGEPPLSSQVNLSVIILDVNDNPPVFSRSTYAITVSESTPVGETLLQLEATDADSGSNALIEFSLVTGDPTFHLALEGNLTLASPLDFETNSSYILVVSAFNTEPGADPAVATVTVTVNNVNEFPPVFLQSEYNAYIVENSSGAFVVQVAAVDMDRVTNITYTFAGGSEVFSIEDGRIFTARALDRENVPEYNLTVVASDNGEPAMTSSVVVMVTVLDINDNVPLIASFQNLSLLDTTPVETLLATFVASDPDSGDNGTVIFSIAGEIVDFSLNATGQLTVASALNASVTSQYSLTIVAQDMGVPPLSSTAVLTIDVEPSPQPIFEQAIYRASIVENNLPGVFLVQVRAYSRDPTVIVSYRLSADSIQLGTLFAVEPNSGNVTALMSLDREQQDLYELTVEALVEVNATILNTTAIVSITVLDQNDNPPIFTNDSQSVQIPETTPPDSMIASLQATDADTLEDAVIQYSIAAGNDTLFTIDQNGSVFTRVSLLSRIGEYRLLVRASNPPSIGSLNSTAVLQITVEPVNRFHPQFELSQYNVTVREDTPTGTILLTLVAMDSDLGTAGEVNYTITAGNNGTFGLDPMSGNLTITSPLDFETRMEYRLTVVATDMGIPPLSSEADVYVQVTDFNDNPPVFTQTRYRGDVLENGPTVQSILDVMVTDSDSAANSNISFSIISEFNDTFEITDSGVIQTTKQLDRELVARYDFVVQASNLGTGVLLTATAAVEITILDQNDNTPQFSMPGYSRVVQAPVEVNTTIVQVGATDIDEGENGTVEFNVSDPSNTFTINATTGVVVVAMEITTGANFTITVIASDLGESPMSNQTTLHVTVLPPHDLTAGREQDFIFTADPGVSLIGSPVETMLDTYQHTFGFLVGRSVRESRAITASLGPLTNSIFVSPPLLPPSSVRAFLLTPEVWYDGPMVRVAVQVRDANHNVQTEPSSVLVQVTRPSSGGVAHMMCIPSSLSGACVASVPVPEAWFSTRANLTVQYGVSSSPLQSLPTAVTLEPRPVFDISNRTYVYMEMPFRPLFKGEEFTVVVYGMTEAAAVGSYTVRVQSSSALTGVRLHANSEWLVQTETVPNGNITITAVRQDQTAIPSPGRVQLFNITARVAPSCPVNTPLQDAIHSTVLFLGDSDRTRVLPPPGEDSTPAYSLSRDGISTLDGTLYVSDDLPLGLLPYATHSELVNTAILNGDTVLTSMTVLGAFLSGTLRAISTATCTSSNVSVVNVTSNCSTILLTEAQTEPSTHDNIMVTHLGLTALLPLHVWVPQLPVTLTTQDTVLNQVPGWFDSNGCTPQYQRTSLTAFTNFTDSNISVSDIDVTGFVTTRLVSSNASVVTMDGSTVQGVRPGVASVSGGSVATQVEFNVTDVSESVLGLDVQVLTALQLTAPGTMDRLSMNPFSIVTEQQFDFEGVEGRVAVAAVFSDNHRMLLWQPDGVVFSSLAENVVQVSNTTVTAVGSGQGELVQAFWSSACSNEPIATGVGVVSVSLPHPENISVALQSSVLAHPGSAASAVGVPSNVSVTITARFAGGRTQVLTNDPRTGYNTSDGIRVLQNGNAIVTVDPSAQAGLYSVRVTFAQFPDLERVFNITVVTLEDLRLTATPFPTYPNSESNQVSVLHPIACTGTRQQATITVTAVLDNGDTRRISSLPNPLNVTASSPQLRAAVNISQNILSVSGTDSTGMLNISATVGSVTSRTPLIVTITSTPAQVVNIMIEPFPDGNTFRGIVNMTIHQVVISVEFNDSTQLFSPQTLPNLVTFSASPTSSLTVNSSTGVATLRGNSFLSPASISVTAVDSGVVQNVTVFCNLDPTFGDVDLGNVTGLPVVTQTVGTNFTLPVRVNSGSAVLDSIELDVTFDSTVIRAVSATRGPDWPAGSAFESTPDDLADIVSLGGILVGATQVSGLSLHLADVQFTALSPGVTNISGTIHTLAEVNTEGGIAENIVEVPATFVAGSIQVQVQSNPGSRRRRNAEAAVSSEHSISRLKRQSTCTRLPCNCTARETGDVDGNCIFDVRDVSFLQRYYLSMVTSSAPPLPDDRAQYLDIDRNGAIDPNDVIFMLRVNFRLLRFATDSTVAMVTEQNCELSINVTLLSRGDVPAQNSSTALVIDFAHEHPVFQAMFDATNFTTGAVLPVSKGPTLYGGLVEAEDLGGGVFGIAGLTAINITDFGISPIQVTFDSLGQTSPVRTAAMFSQSSPRYPALNVSIPLSRGETIPVQAQHGYSPLNLASNRLPSPDCLLRMLPLTFEMVSYVNTILENFTIGEFILQVRAITYRPNAVVSYSLNSSAPVPFRINNITGVIVLSRSLDFESQSSYLFTALATEDGISFTSAEILINVSNVNDLPPEVTQIGELDVPANRSAGDLIFRADARDPDSLDRSLTYGIETAAPPGLFTIDINTGEVTAAVSLLNNSNTTVQLNISVSDSAFTSYLNVDLDIFLPRFTEELYTASVSEFSELGTVVVMVTITDTRNETFNLQSLDSTFAVNDSGVVYVDGILDFEAQRSYLFSIIANSPNFYLEAQVNVTIIDENDNAPVFPQSPFSITLPSSTLIGSSLGQFQATDEDSGSNSVLVYSISPSLQATLFSINSATGELILQQTLLGESPIINITLVAMDMGQPPMNGSAVLTVSVTSVSNITSFPIPPIITTTSGVFLTGESEREANSVTFFQQFGKVSSPSGLLSATYGDTASSVSLTTAPQSATNSSVTLLYPGETVYHDRREVRLVAQVRDPNYHTSTVATTIQVEAIMSPNDTVRSNPCTPDPQYGLCVVNLTLPESWFATSATVSLIPSLNGHLLPLLHLSLHPSSSLPTNLTNQVVVQLPSKDVFWNESFQIDVYGYSTYTISGFSLVFTLDTTLLVQNVTIDLSTWSAQTVFDGNTFVISAILATPTRQVTRLDNTSTLLFSLHLRPTSPTLDVSYNASISAQVRSLANILEGSIVRAPNSTTAVPGLFSSREGVGPVGTIHVISDPLLALLPWTAQPELVNTAVLNGEVVSTHVELFAGYASGSVVAYFGERNCTLTSSAESVVNINSSCRYITLTGSEGWGGDGVEVEFSVGGVTGRLPLRVYYPQLPIRFVVSDTTLNRIQYTLMNNCTTYQRTAISAFTDFVAGSHLLTNTSVTTLLSPVLRSSNESVLATVGDTVQGVAPGSAQVSPSLNETLGCVEFVVTDDSSVNVTAVFASIVVELIVAADNTSLTSGDVATAAVNVRSQLQFEQEVARVVTMVSYSDNTVSAVSDSEVTLLPSTSPAFAVHASNIVAVSSGEGEVQFVWSPKNGQCGLQVSETAIVSVSLPRPVGLRPSLLPAPHNHTLTPPGDPASLAGIPTRLFLQVELIYEGGRTLNVTSDPRTLYSPSSNLTEISNGTVTITEQEVGQGVELIISFNDTNLTTTIQFEIVRTAALRLLVFPYPPYPGSEATSLDTLYPIGNTGMWQRASVVLLLVVTNGDTIDVTQSSEAMVTANPLMEAVMPNISDSFVLSVQGPGTVVLDGTFGSFSNFSVITVSSTPVRVANMTINPLVSNTLSGIAGTSSVQLTVNITFNDSTQYLNFPTNPLLPSLPTLLTFNTSNSAISVSESGLLQPLANSISLVTVQSNAGSVSTTTSFMVNLDPDIGDIDLELNASSPQVGETISVQVFVNTGASSLGSVDIIVTYDPRVLEALEVRPGSGWVGGVQEALLNDPPGEVQFGGALTADGVTGPRLHIFTLLFRVLSATNESYFRGTVVTLAERNIGGTPIGPPTPRPIVAGDITFSTSSAVGKRSTPDATPSSVRSRRRRATNECPLPPCTCSGMTAGDIDGNCAFDVRDVTYTLVYITESLLNFTRPQGQEILSRTGPAQQQQLDPNQDGAIDISDAYFLLRAVFQLVYFLQSVDMTPVQSVNSTCLFSVQVQLSSGGNAEEAQAEVFVDISLTTTDLQPGFDSSFPISGSLGNKGPGLVGGILRARRIDSNVFSVQLNASFVSEDIGISVVLATFDAFNTTDISRTAYFFGPPPPTYTSPLNLTIPVRGSMVFIVATAGYSPLVHASNTLQSQDCSEVPLIGQLTVVFLSPFQVSLEWSLLNMRMGLDFTPLIQLFVTNCSVSQNGSTIDSSCVQYTVTGTHTNTSHTLSTLPFTDYQFQVQGPDTESNRVQIRSPETSMSCDPPP